MSLRKRHVGILGVILGPLLLATGVDARSYQIRVGEIHVRAKAAEASRGARSTLTEALHRELRKNQPGGGRAYVLSASLLELTTQKRGRSVETRCTISGTLREAKGGAIRAFMRGRSQVHDDGASDPESTRLAIEGAVRGLMAQMPSALER